MAHYGTLGPEDFTGMIDEIRGTTVRDVHGGVVFERARERLRGARIPIQARCRFCPARWNEREAA